MSRKDRKRERHESRYRRKSFGTVRETKRLPEPMVQASGTEHALDEQIAACTRRKDEQLSQLRTLNASGRSTLSRWKEWLRPKLVEQRERKRLDLENRMRATLDELQELQSRPTAVTTGQPSATTQEPPRNVNEGDENRLLDERIRALKVQIEQLQPTIGLGRKLAAAALRVLESRRNRAHVQVRIDANRKELRRLLEKRTELRRPVTKAEYLRAAFEETIAPTESKISLLVSALEDLSMEEIRNLIVSLSTPLAYFTPDDEDSISFSFFCANNATFAEIPPPPEYSKTLLNRISGLLRNVNWNDRQRKWRPMWFVETKIDRDRYRQQELDDLVHVVAAVVSLPFRKLVLRKLTAQIEARDLAAHKQSIAAIPVLRQKAVDAFAEWAHTRYRRKNPTREDILEAERRRKAEYDEEQRRIARRADVPRTIGGY